MPGSGRASVDFLLIWGDSSPYKDSQTDLARQTAMAAHWIETAGLHLQARKWWLLQDLDMDWPRNQGWGASAYAGRDLSRMVVLAAGGPSTAVSLVSEFEEVADHETLLWRVPDMVVAASRVEVLGKDYVGQRDKGLRS